VRRKITEKIFKIIAKKKEVVEEDPDYAIISSKLKELPDRKINEFYTYLVSGTTYFNAAGFMMPFQFIEAVNRYKGMILEELWEKHDLEAKAKKLGDKIIGLQIVYAKYSAQEIHERLKNKKLEDYKTKTDEKYFTLEEIQIVKEAGIAAYIENYDVRYGFENELRGFVEREYKSYITKNYFFVREKKIRKLTLLKGDEENE
jgi:hypothetical protein